jgi:hypothetical protein
VTAPQFYVFSADTSNGTVAQVRQTPTFGDATRLAGPFATSALAQAWITANPGALGTSVLLQDKAEVGQWIVIPEGEAGKITQALAYTGGDPLTAVVGVINDDLAIGGDVTISQLTSAQQVLNAETANLVIYPTQSDAQAAADAQNGKSNPSQGSTWEEALKSFLGDLTSQNAWIRAAKIIGGGAILLIGVAKLSGAGGIAAKVVKAAPLL